MPLFPPKSDGYSNTTFTRTFDGTQQPAPWSFTQASVVAERIAEADPGRALLIHNTFRNMVAYDVTEATLHTKQGTKVMDRSAWSKTVDVYNFEWCVAITYVFCTILHYLEG